MKKYIFILLGVAVISISACIEQAGKTELRWQNSQGVTPNPIIEIKWMQDAGTVDQTWNGTYSGDVTTEFKEVDLLNAHGECTDGSFTYQIESNSETNFSLNEGSSETIVIDYLNDITP